MGELGDDLIYGGGGNDWLVGCVDGDGSETGSDRIYGGTGDDTIWGGAGDDRLVGEEGNDTIYGESGNDWLVGCVDGNGSETGRDIIYGGTGNDTLWGGAGNDFLFGEQGNDTLNGETGNDYVDGGADYDTATVDNRLDTLRGAETVSILNIPGGSPQNDSWSCGPNSGSRFLRWYGTNISYEQLRTVARLDGDLLSLVGMGTRPGTLLNILRRFRPETKLESRVDVNYAGGALNRVLDILGTGKPVIALVNAGGYFSESFLGISTGTVPDGLHWIALTGFNKANSTISFTDTSGVSKTWSFGEFYSRWNWSSSGALGGGLTGTLNTAERTILY